MAQAVYAVFTDRICKLLEEGVCPWRQPWRSLAAQNLVSRKPYRGCNALLLGSLPFPSPYFVTFKQALDLGGNVKKGSRGFPVVFWKFLEKEEAGDTPGVLKLERFPMVRYSTVFNLEQTEGLEAPEAPARETIDPASVPTTFPDPAPGLFHGGQRAFYRFSTDSVHLPPVEQFDSKEGYFSTLYHELVHATGTPRRLARFENAVEEHTFGSASYSREELVAEIGAAFLCGETGVSRSLENSASYLQSWLNVLRQPRNVRLILEASGKAQKAAGFILGRRDEGGAA